MSSYYHSSLAPDETAGKVFMARQPIFNRQQVVYGYELLFRSGFENYFKKEIGLDFAASRVLMDSFLVLGMNVLTGGRRAFLNFTENLLVSEAIAMFPSSMVVVELLENVTPSAGVISACRRLKQAGYILALDDFTWDERYQPLVDLADIIKVDFLATSPEEQRDIIPRIGSGRIRFLAEKVETRQVFEAALSMGYTLFQGYFFSRPDIIATRDIPAHKMTYLEILKEINRPEIDFSRLEQVIKRDVSLTYKLLRFINSAAFSLRREIESVRQALTLLGMREVKKWLSLVTLSSLGDDKTEELIVSAIVRARFGELLAPFVGMPDRSPDLFLLGMFSLIDALLDRPMAEILAELPIAPDVKAALTGQSNPLRQIHELIIAYEQADWDKVAVHYRELQLDEAQIPELYLKSLELAYQFFRSRD